MKSAAVALVLVLSACTSSGTSPDSGGASTLEPTTPSPTTTVQGEEVGTTAPGTTTSTIVTGNVRFVIGSVVFGESGAIEIGNLGPDTGALTGFWIAIHPYYLEIPSTIIAPGKAITVSMAEDADPELVIPAAGLLPALKGGSGEIGLYSSGGFGDPDAIVDYVEWGTTGHTRSTVAIAAGLWPEDQAIVIDRSATGLTADDRSDPGPQGWSPTP
ncbi:MAG: hypothetical protein U9R51_06035 [Actinomycetota bacterium]|nr:hypothetical protein [Actinomycetota bacterium]